MLHIFVFKMKINISYMLSFFGLNFNNSNLTLLMNKCLNIMNYVMISKNI